MNPNLTITTKGSFLVALFLQVIGSSYAVQTIQEGKLPGVLDLDRVAGIYNTYIECPTQENARNLIDALPKDRPKEILGNAEAMLGHIFSPDFYPVLFGEAVSGTREAIEIHFRLLNVTDGIFSERVYATLGLVLRNYPHLFLELLQSYKDSEINRASGYPVDFVGAGYNMHPKAAAHVLQKRIEALETVRDVRLLDLSKACIDQLRQVIKQRIESKNDFK